MALMIMTITVARAAAQSPDPRNAATWYLRAIEQYEQIPKATVDLIMNYDWMLPPSPEVRAAVMNVQSVIQTMQRGAALDRCDFDLDRSQGVEMALPHLSRLRSVAKLTRADASIRLADGDTTGAADRISSLYRLSGHGGDDRVIISSLVGQAIFHLADGLLQTGVDQGAFDAANAAKLLGAVEQLGTDDPFAYTEAIAGEQEMFVVWMEVKFSDPAERTKLGGMFFLDPADPKADLLSSLTDEEFQTALGQYDDVMTRMVEVFSNPDPEAAQAQLATVEAEIVSGQLGPMVQTLMPALGKCYETKLKGEVAIAGRLELLRKLAAGEAKPEAFANAAVWYIRAIELLEQTVEPLTTPEALHALRTFAAEPIGAGLIDDELQSTLTKLTPVIDLLREGSAKDRCDFKFARDSMPWLSRSPMVTPYAACMHDCLRLLHLNILRTVSAGKPGEVAALERVLCVLRVQRHLGGDPNFSSALVSHHHFQRTMELLARCFEQGIITDAYKPAIMDEVEQFSRSDPFSYIAALGGAREWLTPQTSLGQRDADPQLVATCEHTLRMLTADQAAYLMVLADTLQRNGDEQLVAQVAAGPPPEHWFPLDSALLDRERAWWERLHDIYDADAIASTRRELATVATMMHPFDCAIFTARGAQPLPTVAYQTLGHRMREARADLRRASMQLSSIAETDQPSAPDMPR